AHVDPLLGAAADDAESSSETAAPPEVEVVPEQPAAASEVTILLPVARAADTAPDLPEIWVPRIHLVPANWRIGLPDPVARLGWLSFGRARLVATIFDTLLGRLVR